MHPALLLTFLSLFITFGASIAKAYPYGGVRQCLFLAPGVALIAGLAFADLVQRIKSSRQRAVPARPQSWESSWSCS